MKVKRTVLLSANVRQETIPEVSEEQYYALLFDEEVSVSVATAEYLITYKYAEEVKE